MYPEVVTKRGASLPAKWTAHGSALPAAKSPKNLRQDIGREGVVATVVSKLCKFRGKRFALQADGAISPEGARDQPLDA